MIMLQTVDQSANIMSTYTHDSPFYYVMLRQRMFFYFVISATLLIGSLALSSNVTYDITS